MFTKARAFADVKGYNNIQEFIRETVREKLFEVPELLSGLQTYQASEKSLAKNWLTKEEEKAWKHLQNQK